jgi:hypothetical protein
MADFAKVAKTTEIEPGQARPVDVKGRENALFNTRRTRSFTPPNSTRFSTLSAGVATGPPTYRPASQRDG